MTLLDTFAAETALAEFEAAREALWAASSHRASRHLHGELCSIVKVSRARLAARLADSETD